MTSNHTLASRRSAPDPADLRPVILQKTSGSTDTERGLRKGLVAGWVRSEDLTLLQARVGSRSTAPLTAEQWALDHCGRVALSGPLLHEESISALSTFDPAGLRELTDEAQLRLPNDDDPWLYARATLFKRGPSDGLNTVYLRRGGCLDVWVDVRDQDGSAPRVPGVLACSGRSVPIPRDEIACWSYRLDWLDL